MLIRFLAVFLMWTFFSPVLEASYKKLASGEQKSFIASPKKTQISAQKHYKYGLKLYKKRKIKKAIVHFDKAIEKNPKYGMAYFYKGMAHVSLGQPEQAIPALNKAIKTAKKIPSWYAKPYYQKGMAYMMLNKTKKAIKFYSKAVNANPSAQVYTARATAYTILAKPHYDKGNKKKGQQWLELARLDIKRAIHSNPKIPAVWSLKARLHQALGEEPAALNAAKRACQLGDCRLLKSKRKGQKAKGKENTKQ